MTETHAVSIEDVRMLVGERQRYDDWLTALEAKRAETPTRVFTRVHGDYSARRAAVMEKLQNHLGEIASLADQLDARLGALDSSLSSLEDERAEAMLRTAVGEFDSERWENVRKEVEAKIATISEERAGLLTEVEDVRSLLARARSEPQLSHNAPVDHAEILPIVAVAVPEEAPQAKVDAFSQASDAAGRIDADVSLVEEVSVSEDAETLDLEDALALFTPSPAIVDSAPTMVDTAGIEVISNSSQHVASNGGQPDDDPFDDLAFLRSVTDSPPTAAAGATAATRTSAAAATSQKTLRCTECGTMNLPTEWYCERCGGELAAF
jgi:hypothetical protein